MLEVSDSLILAQRAEHTLAQLGYQNIHIKAGNGYEGWAVLEWECCLKDSAQGAAEGAGLGIQFLKHLERCRLLLHVVDVLPADGSDPAENAVTIVHELAKYSEKLAGKPRWLVFNKLDLVLEDELEEIISKVTTALNWDGPVCSIAAASRNNTDRLAADILNYIELLPAEQVSEQIADPMNFKWDDSPTDIQAVIDEDDDDDDFDDDDYDVEVIYQR